MASLLRPASDSAREDHTELIIRYLTWRQLVWRRFRRHPLALAGAGMLAFIVLLVVVGPAIAPPLPTRVGTLTLAQLDILAHHDTAPEWSWRYLMGTDQFSRPVLTIVLSGGQTAIVVGLFGALLATIIGVSLGAISGYVGGWIDALAMRAVDAFLAMPFIPLLLLTITSLSGTFAVGVFGAWQNNQSGLIILFGLLGWPQVARLVRGYVLSLREWEFVEAARATGLSEPSIIFRQILPNVLGIIVVALTLNVAVFIGAEVTLDFLNPPPGGPDSPPLIVSWGSSLYFAYLQILSNEWWGVLFPSLAVLLAILGVNLLGDGLRDAIDASAQDPVEIRDSGRRWFSAPSTLRTGMPIFVAAISTARTAAGASGQRIRGTFHLPAASLPLLHRLPHVTLPVPLIIAPVALAYLLCGIIFLAGHAPVTRAPHYPAPTTLPTISEGTAFGATRLPDGGWALLEQDGQQLLFRRTNPGGTTIASQTVAAHALGITSVTMGQSGGRLLGAWLQPGARGIALHAAYLGTISQLTTHNPQLTTAPFTITTADSLRHPSVLALPHGGFGVLYDRGRGARTDIYLATVRGNARHVTIHRLVRAGTSAMVPRGAVDGSGHLDALYMNLCCNASTWNLVVRRFSLSGRPLAPPATIGPITSLTPFGQTARVPEDWGIQVLPDVDGSVWGMGLTDNGLEVGHWSRTGDPLLPPTPLSCPDPSLASIVNESPQLVLAGGRHFIYYLSSSQTGGTHPYGLSFANPGAADPSACVDVGRIAYDFGGGASVLRASGTGDTAAAIWQKRLYSGRTVLTSTAYQSNEPFDLAAQLGLNVGPVWANVAVVTLGALTAAVPLTAINVFLILLLLLLWVVLSHVVRGPLRWPIYVILLAVVLLWLFVWSSSLPGWIFAITPWTGFYAPLAVLAAVSTAGWLGFTALRHQDDGFRAVGMAIAAVYFLAALSAAVAIGGQLAQV